MIKAVKKKSFFNYPMGQKMDSFYVISTFCWSEALKKKGNYVVPLELCRACVHCDLQEFFQRKCKEAKDE